MRMLLTEVAHWGLALVPVLVLLAIFVWLDAFKLMSLREILVLLLLGGVAARSPSWPVSGRLLDTLPIGFSIYSRFVAPWIEEAIKAVVMIGLFRINRIGYKLDAVISGFAIGAGFSVVENIIYLMRLPRLRRRHLAGARARHRGDARHHARASSPPSRTSSPSARRAKLPATSISTCWWFVPGYLARGRDPHRLQPVPRPAADRDAGRDRSSRRSRSIAIFNFGTAEAAALARRRNAPSTRRSSKRCAPAAGRTAQRPEDRRACRAARAGRLQSASAATGSCRPGWCVEAEETMMEEAAGDVDRSTRPRSAPPSPSSTACSARSAAAPSRR